MDSLLITLIVPIYNVERYLSKCINSILKQTYVNFEVILVDDGSTDNSFNICSNFAKKDSRVKLIRKENNGVTSARKAGLKIAQGGYIGFVDGDDWVEHNLLQRLADLLEHHEYDMILYNMFTSYEDKEIEANIFAREGAYSKEELIDNIYKKMLFNGNYYEFGIHPSVWTKMFKADLLKKNLDKVDDKIIIGEDVACTYACLLDANSIYVLKDCLYHYRQNDESLTHSYHKGLFLNTKILVNYIENLIVEEHAYMLCEQLDYYCMFLICANISNEYRTKCPHTMIEKYKLIKKELNYYNIKNHLAKVRLSMIPQIKNKLFIAFIKRKCVLVIILVYQLKFLLKNTFKFGRNKYGV